MALNGGITMIDKLTIFKEIIVKIIADYDLKEDEIKIIEYIKEMKLTARETLTIKAA